MVSRSKSKSPPALQLCCFVILLLIVALIILYFTVLKPREPDISATVVGLQHIESRPYPNFTLNIMVDVDVTVHNPNYAGFEFDSGTTLIYYRGSLVGRAPVVEGGVGARSTETITTTVDLDVSTMAANPAFVSDIASGMLTLDSSTSLHGKVTLLGIFELRVSTFTSCQIVVALKTSSTSANCRSNITS